MVEMEANVHPGISIEWNQKTLKRKMNLNVVSVHTYLLFQSKNEVKNRFLFFVFCIFFQGLNIILKEQDPKPRD